MTRLVSTLLVVTAFAVAAPPASAQTPADDPPVRLESQSIRVEAQPRRVTVYKDRAAVTRSVRRLLGPGTYELIFSQLPARVEREALQASVRGPGRILGVEYLERAAADAANPRLARLDAERADNQEKLTQRREDRELIDARWADLNAVSTRTAGAAGADGGSDAIDLDTVRDQLAFFASERRKLLEERRAVDASIRTLNDERRRLDAERESLGDAAGTTREAIVTVAVDGGTEIFVDLVYLVRDATWTPAYNVRASGNGARVDIEYDALIEQRSGEDWRDVELVLSTAQPARATDPPEVSPWIVDVRDADAGAAPADADMVGAALESLGPEVATADTVIRGDGPAVTYALSRRASVLSDTRRQQRARIANVACRPVYTHVAIPLMTEAVYVRSDLLNESDYPLLPGPVAIFVGPDFIGRTTIDGIAPREAFAVSFGVDRAITAKRTLVAQGEARTGLLGGGIKTSYDYRIEINNGTGKAIALELWDRMPIARSDRLEIQLVDLTHDLSGDAEYLERDFDRGLLKWDLSVPATARNADALIVEFGVRVVRAKDVEVRGLE